MLAGRWWTGQQYFFNVTKEGGNFGTGIYSDVLNKLREMGVPFQINDFSVKVPSSFHNINLFQSQPLQFHSERVEEETQKQVKKEKIVKVKEEEKTGKVKELYDYQKKVLETVLQNSSSRIGGVRGIVECPTGSGKTMMFGSLIKAFNSNFQTIVLFRNKSLVEQTYKAFKEIGVDGVGRVHGEVVEVENKVICATVQSLHKVPEYIIKNTQVLIVDECHLFSSKQSLKALKSFPNCFMRLGWSATPWREHDEPHNWRLKSFLGPLLVDISTKSLQSTNVLSQSICYFHQIHQPKRIKSLSYEEACEKGLFNNQKLNEKIAAIVNEIEEGRILILVRSLIHGDNLSKLLPDAFWIKGEDDMLTREFVFGELRKSNKKKVVAISSTIGFVGVNVYVHHIINAFGGKDPNVTIQVMVRKPLFHLFASFHLFVYIFLKGTWIEKSRRQGHCCLS